MRKPWTTYLIPAFLIVLILSFAMTIQQDVANREYILQVKDYKEQLDRANEELHLANSLVQSYKATTAELRKEIEDLQLENERLQSELTAHKDKSVQIASIQDDVKVLEDFQLTWYNHNSGRTFTDTVPKDDHTVAVDPKVIPLNTWVIIEMPDGTLKKRRTEDTGGAVKGHIIDEYDPAPSKELYKRGRTYGVKVYIIGKGE